MPHKHIIIICCTKHNTTIIQNIFCSNSKNTTRSTFFQKFILFSSNGIHTQRTSIYDLIILRTRFPTSTTIYTLILIYDRVKKTFLVRFHRYTMLWTHFLTCPTTCTRFCYINHFFSSFALDTDNIRSIYSSPFFLSLSRTAFTGTKSICESAAWIFLKSVIALSCKETILRRL